MNSARSCFDSTLFFRFSDAMSSSEPNGLDDDETRIRCLLKAGTRVQSYEVDSIRRRQLRLILRSRPALEQLSMSMTDEQ
jgi:hypothetical protein